MIRGPVGRVRWSVAGSLGLPGLMACGSPVAPSDPPAPRFAIPADLGAPVSSDGWEDSGFVTPNGQYFYFTYLRFNPILFIQTGAIVVRGPLRPNFPASDSLAAKIYRAEFVNGSWREPENLDIGINRSNALNGDEWVSADGDRILFSDPVPQPGRTEQGIYYAERQNGIWTEATPARLQGFPFVPGDENPHLTLDEQTLFFESSRPGGQGGPDLWIATKGATGWSAPVNVGSVVNTAGTEGSPFSLDGTELYFDDKGGGKGISWSHRRSDGSWSPPVIVVPGSWGDPSLTQSGDLYLIGGLIDSTGLPDANPFMAKRIR